ncbi:MAG: nuclear transport factor 2 family protein [Armatimonadota bacterium]
MSSGPQEDRRKLLASMGAALLLPALAPQPVEAAARDRRARRALERLERTWSDAFNSRDEATLNRLLARDFVFVDQFGAVLTKAEYVDMVVNHIEVISGDIFDLDIRVFGDTGIAVGRFTGTTRFDGVESTGSFRFIDVWARRGGRWVAVSSQDTIIPE